MSALVTPGNLRSALAAIRTQDSALAACDGRLVRHRGHKKVVVAAAHPILRTTYNVLTRQTAYEDPGSHSFDRRHAERVRRRTVRLLEHQGYRVTMKPPAYE